MTHRTKRTRRALWVALGVTAATVTGIPVSLFAEDPGSRTVHRLPVVGKVTNSTPAPPKAEWNGKASNIQMPKLPEIAAPPRIAEPSPVATPQRIAAPSPVAEPPRIPTAPVTDPGPLAQPPGIAQPPQVTAPFQMPAPIEPFAAGPTDSGDSLGSSELLINKLPVSPAPLADDPAEDVPAVATSDSVESDSDGETVPLSDYKDLLSRVDDLESAWTKHKDKLDDEAAAKKKKSFWKMSGRVHLDNWNFLDTDAGSNFLETGDVNEDPQDRWDFRRIRLEIAGTVPNNMLFRTQIDFNNPSTPEMKDVYLGFNNLPHNQTLLIGNQKRPIGLDHLNSSRHNVFAERPLAVETFNEDARRLGVCMYGHTDNEVINWRYGAFLLENVSRSGRYRGDFDEAGLYGRIAASPWYDKTSGGRGYYHCAIVGSVNQTDADGQFDEDDNDNEARFRTRPLARSSSRWWNTNRIPGADGYQQLGYESVLNIGSLQITSEYFGAWVQRGALAGFSGEDLTFHGGYIYASYFLTGEHIPWNRKAGTIDRVRPFENFFVVDRCCGGCGHGMGALAMALRYDYLDLTDSDIRGGRGYAITGGLNWYWTAYSKLQTNIIWGQIRDGGQGQADPNAPLPAGVDGDFTILGFRYMIDF